MSINAFYHLNYYSLAINSVFRHLGQKISLQVNEMEQLTIACRAWKISLQISMGFLLTIATPEQLSIFVSTHGIKKRMSDLAKNGHQALGMEITSKVSFPFTRDDTGEVRLLYNSGVSLFQHILLPANDDPSTGVVAGLFQSPSKSYASKIELSKSLLFLVAEVTMFPDWTTSHRIVRLIIRLVDSIWKPLQPKVPESSTLSTLLPTTTPKIEYQLRCSISSSLIQVNNFLFDNSLQENGTLPEERLIDVFIESTLPSSKLVDHFDGKMHTLEALFIICSRCWHV